MKIKQIKTTEDIRQFLKAAGFQRVAAGNGCVEYYLTVGCNTLQINGEGLSDIDTTTEIIHVTVFPPNEIDEVLYYIKYNSLQELVQNEPLINFKPALKHWHF